MKKKTLIENQENKFNEYSTFENKMSNVTKINKKGAKIKLDKFGFTKRDIDLFEEAEKKNCYY